MSDEDLIVDVPTSALADLCSPFRGSVWRRMKRPVTREEITKALEADDLLPPDGKPTADLSRKQHIARITWFVRHGWSDPVEIDVGIPTFGGHVDWPLIDGNHRFAAALYLGHHTIRSGFNGSVDYGIEVGLLDAADFEMQTGP